MKAGSGAGRSRGRPCFVSDGARGRASRRTGCAAGAGRVAASRDDGQDLRSRRRRGAHRRRMGGGAGLPGRPPRPRRRRALQHHDPAAERDGLAAYGPRPQQHAPGRARPLRAPARQGRAVAARHGPRRHRHPDGSGAPPRRAAAARPAQLGPAGIRPPGLGVEGGIRRHHRQPAQAARRLLRLVAGALHHGRGPVEGRPEGLRRPARAGPDLPRQAPGELGPEVPDRDLRPRGAAGRGEGPSLALRLSGGGRGRHRDRRDHHGRHHPARDHAGRHRRGGPPGGRALPGARRQAAAPAARRPPDPDRGRRVFRSREGHRRGQDHPGARLQRLRGRPPARARPDQYFG